MGTVFQIQRFSLFDGPGVRTVVFLKGCPLRCKWCHNPEGLSHKPQILFQASRCIGCMDCVSACVHCCHADADGLHRFDRTGCIGCGKCARQCCTGALSLAGMEMTAQEVLAQVLRDREVYLQSGGGMTLSGGEPFAQPEFTMQLLQEAKQAGLHTAIETSGYAPADVIQAAAAYTDLFLYDYKATGEALHKALCGVSNRRILENLQLLDALGAQVILRCPIIPGQNQTPEHIHGICTVAAAHSCIQQVHLEPYHRLGTDKAAQLSVDPFDTEVPDKKQLEAYCSQIREFSGKPAQISA